MVQQWTRREFVKSATVLAGTALGAGRLAAPRVLANASPGAKLGVAVIGSVFFAVLGNPPEVVGYVRAIGVSLFLNLGLLALTFGLVCLLPRWPAADHTARHAEF